MSPLNLFFYFFQQSSGGYTARSMLNLSPTCHRLINKCTHQKGPSKAAPSTIIYKCNRRRAFQHMLAQHFSAGRMTSHSHPTAFNLQWFFVSYSRRIFAAIQCIAHFASFRMMREATARDPMPSVCTQTSSNDHHAVSSVHILHIEAHRVVHSRFNDIMASLNATRAALALLDGIYFGFKRR